MKSVEPVCQPLSPISMCAWFLLPRSAVSLCPSSWVEKPKEGVVLTNDLATCQAAEAGGWRVGGQRGLIANYI